MVKERRATNANKWQWEEIAQKSLEKARGLLQCRYDYMTDESTERLITLVAIAALAEDRARREDKEGDA